MNWATKLAGISAYLITAGYVIFIGFVIYIGVKCYKDWKKRNDNDED